MFFFGSENVEHITRLIVFSGKVAKVENVVFAIERKVDCCTDSRHFFIFIEYSFLLETHYLVVTWTHSIYEICLILIIFAYK